MSAANTTLYFAYGSNLSPTQMSSRCPSSPPVGLAHLPDYAFIISTRRYANVVPNPVPVPTDPTANPGVYGVLYALAPEDEASLDGYEGVPFAYTKELLLVDVLEASLPEPALGVTGAPSATAAAASATADAAKEAVLNKTKSVNALVYIDRVRTDHADPYTEYVDRINRGVDEASARFGLPATYVQDTIRKWIPAPKAPLDAAAIEDPFSGLA